MSLPGRCVVHYRQDLDVLLEVLTVAVGELGSDFALSVHGPLALVQTHSTGTQVEFSPGIDDPGFPRCLFADVCFAVSSLIDPLSHYVGQC